MEQEAVQEEQVTPEVTPHEQEMLDLVDNKEAKAQGQADPEKAPEFVEEVKAPEIDYKAEYEKLKASQEEEQVSNEPETPQVEAVETEEPTLGDFVEDYRTSGVLTEDTLKGLESLGVSPDLAESFLQGQAAIVEAQEAKAYEATGGKEGFETMVTWAKETWTPEQIEVFNAAVSSGDTETMMFGINSLTSQYKAANGEGLPKRVLKGTQQGTSGNTNSFETKADMYKAMNNSMYGKDASYTNMVATKIANSRF